jgi:hypothetical protein
VEVEVVLGQVGEDEHVEADAVKATLLRAVRGCLHDAAAVACVEHLPEHPLDVDRLGRRPHRRTDLAADTAFDRPEQPGTQSGRLENRIEEERRGRLPVRSRDAGDDELLAWPAEEVVRRDSHRCARVRHHELRHLELELALHDKADRTPLDRLRGEVMSVRPLARNAEEQSAGHDRTRVVGQVSRAQISDETLEGHRNASLLMGQDPEILQVELGDVLEDGRRHHPPEDRPLRLVDSHHHKQLRI